VTVGSEGRGTGAVAWARTKIGAPYLLGAAGPSAYDCSGLTMMSWASQGVDITRTSRSQYLAVGKVGYGSLRPGDLIFYGSEPSDPSSIYHVAMYTGGGMMIEATLPGHPLSENPLRLSGAMPFAGRP
jgi:cell wall-associated NlpC family hydrolase